MGKIQRIVFISLFTILSIGTTRGDYTNAALISATTTGVALLENPALTTVLVHVFAVAGAAGVSSMIVSDQKEQFVQAKAIILKEIVDYQSTEKIGIVLDAVIRAIKEKNSELSDAEAIDALLEELNH
jgi:hypothetical protein